MADVRYQLSQLIRAEKNAILAQTDEESKKYAATAATELQKLHAALDALNKVYEKDSGVTPEERTVLAEIPKALLDVEKNDKELLDLAV